MKITEKAQCCGCTACQHVCPRNAITMTEDGSGFKYPKIDPLRCIECGLCQKVCPVTTFKAPATPHYQVFAAKHKSEDVLQRSSSGGMFTAFSDYILNKGGVVYGCRYDNDFKLAHQRVADRNGRDSLCGSKYVQSDLRDCFVQIKKDMMDSRDVCFIGTPCQCAGIQSFLTNTNTDTLHLFTIALICHGVPSPGLFQEYLEYCSKKSKARIIDYEHRPKHRHWGHVERAKFIYDNGASDSDSVLSQGWKWLFYSNAALRPCCYDCPWAKDGHTADVTIGDYWGIEDCMPDLYDKMGVSAVLINTKKGEYILGEIADTLEIRRSSFKDVIRKNPNLTVPSKPLTDKDRFWRIYHQKGFSALIAKYGHINLYYRIRNMAGRLLRKMGVFS